MATPRNPSSFEVAISVALLIGVGVVGWCANTIVDQGKQISALTTAQDCHKK